MPSRGLLSHCEIFANLHLKLGSSDREMEASVIQTTAHAAAGLDTSTTVLYCTVLYCTVLYCTVLYCTAGLDTSTRSQEDICHQYHQHHSNHCIVISTEEWQTQRF